MRASRGLFDRECRTCANVTHSGTSCVQIKGVQEAMFDAVQSCRLDCVLLAPLIRALSLFSLKRGCQPAAVGRGQRWQDKVFATCHATVVACLEQLDQSLDNPERAHTCLQLAACASSTRCPSRCCLVATSGLTAWSRVQALRLRR